MNPLLPVLVLLSVAPLLLRRRGLAVAWAAAGLAAVLWLAPTLAVPDAVPGAGALLAPNAPWGELDREAPANPHLRDVAFQIHPWMHFLREELRAGRAPLWNPHQHAGEPFWSQGQPAPLFPLHLLFATLPLQAGLLLLPWLRLVAAGCGAWLLARELGVGPGPALVAAIAFPLSGAVTSFALYPIGNAIALVPWVLWAAERVVAGRSSWGLLALLAGLQLASGHPETAVFTAVLSAVYLLVRGVAGAATAWGRILVAWAVAGAVSAIHTLPLAHTLLLSARWRTWEPPEPFAAGELAAALWRWIFPGLLGHPVDGTWWGPFNSIASAVYPGLLVLLLAAAGLAWAPASRRWLAVAAMALFALAAAYQAPGLRELLLALPVLQAGLHHYFKVGAVLGVVLLAAAGCERWIAGGAGRGLAAGAGALLAATALSWLWAGPALAAAGLTGRHLAWSVAAAAAAALALGARWVPVRARGLAWALVPALLAVDLAAAHGRTYVPTPLTELYPRTELVEFLAGRPGRIVGVGEALRPNAAMVYGLADVRGDTPVKLAHLEAAAATFAAPAPTGMGPVQDWKSPWLDRLAVRWVVSGPGKPPPREDWLLAYDGGDGRVFERPATPPVVRWERGGAAARLEVLERRPGRWRIAWESPEADRLVVAETWDPGWRAAATGGAPGVELADGLLLAVPLGPGRGEVELRYVPLGFRLGALLSLSGLVVAGTALAASRRRRKVEA